MYQGFTWSKAAPSPHLSIAGSPKIHEVTQGVYPEDGEYLDAVAGDVVTVLYSDGRYAYAAKGAPPDEEPNPDVVTRCGWIPLTALTNHPIR